MDLAVCLTSLVSGSLFLLPCVLKRSFFCVKAGISFAGIESDCANVLRWCVALVALILCGKFC